MILEIGHNIMDLIIHDITLMIILTLLLRHEGYDLSIIYGFYVRSCRYIDGLRIFVVVRCCVRGIIWRIVKRSLVCVASLG